MKNSCWLSLILDFYYKYYTIYYKQIRIYLPIIMVILYYSILYIGVMSVCNIWKSERIHIMYT